MDFKIKTLIYVIVLLACFGYVFLAFPGSPTLDEAINNPGELQDFDTSLRFYGLVTIILLPVIFLFHLGYTVIVFDHIGKNKKSIIWGFIVLIAPLIGGLLYYFIESKH